MTETDRHGLTPDDDPDTIDGMGPTIEQIMRSAADWMGGGEGWNGLPTEEMLTRQRMETARTMQREARAFSATFGTEDGRMVLQAMLDLTLLASPYPADAMLRRDQIETLVLVHDAQCNFVRAILAAIAQAKTQNEAARTGA